MKKMITIVGIVILSACNHASPNREGNKAIDLSVVPTKYKTLFKLTHQNNFAFDYRDIDSLGLVKLDSIQFGALIQEDELIVFNTSDYDHYFYSYQNGRTDCQPITLLINEDYSFRVYYLMYSKDGTLLSKFEVSKKAGDGPFGNKSYGYFINDTTYLKTDISMEFSEEGKSLRRDSTSHQIKFDRRGKLIYY